VADGQPITLLCLIAARSIAEAMQAAFEAGERPKPVDERGAIDLTDPATLLERRQSWNSQS
jgi:hypothetical protein